jgi:transposase
VEAFSWLSRNQLLPFLARHPFCIVAVEACATAHYWGREIEMLGHKVRLIPPVYVEPFVKRQKNDAADAEAIAESAARPTMRFVALKTEEQQARAMIFRARDLLVRQRTQLINALRGHLAEFGVVAPQGIAHVRRLQEAIDDPQAELPPVVRDIGRAYLDQITRCSGKIAEMETTLRAEAAQGEATARLQTMPGIGPIAAMAIEAFAPPMASFRRGRDFSAWLGLVPRQKSTGGKQILGKTSKMGQRDIRRLLIIGAMAVVRWATRNGALEGSWLARMLARKPRMVVAIALANKMARSAWAMLVKQENYRDLVAAAP